MEINVYFGPPPKSAWKKEKKKLEDISTSLFLSHIFNKIFDFLSGLKVLDSVRSCWRYPVDFKFSSACLCFHPECCSTSLLNYSIAFQLLYYKI